MRQKPGPQGSAEKHVNEIRRATRKQYSAEEKIYSWSKEFIEAGNGGWLVRSRWS